MPELKPMNVPDGPSHGSKVKTAAVFAICVAAAIASVVAAALIGKNTYIIASVAVVVCAIIPFFFAFEEGRPSAGKVALVAVMCVLAIASRAIFAPIPFFKPIAGIVFISGLAFGSTSGFTVGAVSMLVSNFMFGQGPWTPWQMLAFGLCGAVAGSLRRSTDAQSGNMGWVCLALVSIFAGLFYVLVAGPILDTSSVFFMLSRITLEGAIAVYIAGLPVNAIQAIATALTVFFLGNPLLRKLSKVS